MNGLSRYAKWLNERNTKLVLEYFFSTNRVTLSPPNITLKLVHLSMLFTNNALNHRHYSFYILPQDVERVIEGLHPSSENNMKELGLKPTNEHLPKGSIAIGQYLSYVL
jgi:hypothetical protein